MAKVHDPVCGMDIEQSTAAGSARYEGETYYFCSPGCQRAFEANPADFAGATHAARDTSDSDPNDVVVPERMPPFTTTGPFTEPMFGSAGSGGLEYEPLPTKEPRKDADDERR